MRIMLMVMLLLGLAACNQAHGGGSVRIDGLGSASWNDHSHHKGCPPGLAKQGRC